jgi:hypothetical protein
LSAKVSKPAVEPLSFAQFAACQSQPLKAADLKPISNCQWFWDRPSLPVPLIRRVCDLRALRPVFRYSTLPTISRSRRPAIVQLFLPPAKFAPQPVRNLPRAWCRPVFPPGSFRGPPQTVSPTTRRGERSIFPIAMVA